MDRLVRDLEVGHFPRHDSDRDTDSELMRQGFEMTGSSTTRALRLVPNCQRANLCPSVCPVGAKNSMSRTLIPRGLSNGGTVITECEVHEISTLKQQSHLVVSTTPRGLLGIECQAVVFAAGTLRTPGLLGTHTKKRVFPLGLHLNVKVIAKFSEPVQAEHSTIFTLQAQDWLHEGIVIMPANLRPEYLAMGIGSASNIEALKLLRDIDSLGLYTVQIRPVHSGRLVRIRGKTTVPWWWITNSDTELATQGIKHLADALFSVGAVSLRLPLRGLPEVTSLAQCTEITRTAKSGDWLFTSVHAMSSTPMGEHSQFCDSNGAVIGHPGLWIGDASALPSTVGESPQGAIMLHAAAMSRSVLERL